MRDLPEQIKEVSSNQNFIHRTQAKSNPDFSILIVDDVPKNIQALGNILKQEEYQISFALNGEDALKLIKDHYYDLILLDIMMPGLNGYEVCRILKKDPCTCDIPVIFITAKAENHNVVQGFVVGGQDYIAKPFNSAELLARVKTHLELREKNQQLNDLNRNLEKEVHSRTLELKNANRKLAQLDQAKSEFLKQISHELRNPLQSIIAVTGLLKESEQEAGIVGYLEESTLRLEKISETALLITSLQAESKPLDLFETSIDDIIDNSISSFQDKLADKQIKLTINKQLNLNCLIQSDLVKKCMNSILENAIQFSNKGEVIAIESKKDKGMIELSITDQGPGFSQLAFDNFKKPFNIVNSIEYEGLGTSLYIVHLVMEAHDGKLDLIQGEGKTKLQMIFPDKK